MCRMPQGKRLPPEVDSGEVTEEDESGDQKTNNKPRQIKLCSELSRLICPFLQSVNLKDISLLPTKCTVLVVVLGPSHARFRRSKSVFGECE